MSQINTYANLILQKDSFLTDLKVLEGEIVSFGRRVGMMPIKIPVTMQASVVNGPGGNGAGPAASMQSLSGGNDLMSKLRGYVEEFGATTADYKTTSGMWRGFVEEFGSATQQYRAAVAMVQENAAMASGGGGGGGVVDDAGPPAGGGQTASPSIGLGSRLGRGTIGGLVAYYGVSSLMRTLEQNSELTEAEKSNDPGDQATKSLAVAKDQNSGLMGWMRRNRAFSGYVLGGPVGGAVEEYGRGIFTNKKGQRDSSDIEQIESTLEGATREDARSKKQTAAVQQSVKDMADGEVKIAGLVHGAAAGHKAALEHWQQAQEKAIEELRESGVPAGAITTLRNQTAQIVAAEQEQAKREETGEQADTQASVAGYWQAGQSSRLREQNRNKEADRLDEENKLTDHASELRRRADAEKNPEKRARMEKVAQAAEDALPDEMSALHAGWKRQDQKDDTASADAVSDSQSRGHVADLIAAGQTQEASRQSRIDAIDKRTREAKEALDTADPADKQKRQNEYDAAAAEGEKEKAAIAAQELKRVRESVADFVIGKDRAMLSEATKDYQAETKIWSEEWDKRIAKLQTSEEKAAALQQKEAERQARELKHQHEIADIRETGSESFVRASGNDEMADLMRLKHETDNQIREAGGDVEQVKAIAYRAEGRVAEMLRRDSRPQMFGSWTDYLHSVQMSALSGSGSSVKALHDYGKVLGDEAKTGVVSDKDKNVLDKWDKVADKMLQAGQLWVVRQ